MVISRWRVAYKVRVVIAILLGSGRAIVRRTRHGPTLPTWTWSEELFVGVSRAVAIASARNVAFMTPR